MNARSTVMIFLVFLLLTLFCSCRRQTRTVEAPQPNQSAQVQQQRSEPDWQDDPHLPPLSFPMTFVLSKPAKGMLTFRQLGASPNDAGKFYRYEKYDVMTTPSGGASDRIDVFKRIAARNDTLVITEADSIILTNGVSGSWFDRVIDDLLTVTLTTGPGPEVMWVFDLRSANRTCSVMTHGVHWNGFSVTSWEPSDSGASADNCPEFAAWKEAGIGAGLEEQYTLNIRTCVKHKSGIFRCVPLQ